MRDSDYSYHAQDTQINTDFFLVAQRLRTMGVEPSDDDNNKRKHRREVRSISLSIQPLDDDFQPEGPVFWVVSRDISVEGIGLISPEPIYQKHVRLGLLEERVTTIGRVCHSTSIGNEYPLYLIGIEFVSDPPLEA
ncbi:MAG: hypothetical protein AB8B55_07195 [Mariniblastus sp.]